MTASKSLATLASLIISTASGAQILGTWDGYLPYRNTVSVAAGPDWIYAATDLAYFQYHRTDQYVARRHKANGLSDIGTHLVAWHAGRNLLLTTYNNCNIDIVKGDTVQNLSDIKTASIVGKKTINHIHFDGNLAYLSCSFGIVLIDLDHLEVRDTYKPESTDIEIHATATANGEIFASTENGLYTASLTNGDNLLDFHTWHKDSVAENFFDWDIDTGLVIPFDGTVIARSHDSLLKYNSGTWDFFYHDLGWQPVHLSVSGNQLVVVEHQPSGNQQPNSARITVIQPNGTAASYMQGIVPVPLQAALTDDGQIWAADLYLGLKRYRISDGTSESIIPNGPYSNKVIEMDAGDGKLWVVAGGLTSDLNFLYIQDGFFLYDNGTWKNYHRDTHPPIANSFDWITVMMDPENSRRAFVGSHYSGLAIVEGDDIQVYDQYNSPLQGFGNVTHVGAFAMDADRNLWISNDGASEPLVVMKPNGNWLSFPVPSTSKEIFQIVIDDNNQKWTLTGRSSTQGPVVYNHGSDLDNKGDDKSTVLTTQIGNGALPNNDDISIANDLDGDIWLGTSEGIAVFYCAEVVVDDDCDASRIIVEKDGFLGYLLETEVIRDIEVDGGNRKWVATENGTFLLSEDGTKELLHFTETNSPLFSNSILDIAIDQSTGVVWFGTEQGINSYQGDAIAGSETHDCFIYPNPVREDYNGPIVIKGLVQDADVRITDVAGNLAYHTTANGGMATWDGNLFNGSRAHSGVYYVFSANSDGSEKTVCKLLFVN